MFMCVRLSACVCVSAHVYVCLSESQMHMQFFSFRRCVFSEVAGSLTKLNIIQRRYALNRNTDSAALDDLHITI